MSEHKINDKQALSIQLLALIDESYELISLYNKIPLKYGDNLLYKAETHTIQQIGKNPGITVSEIAKKMNKTISACSQIIKKLRNRGAIVQKRNPNNNREYNIELTEYGWCIFEEHENLDRLNYANIFKGISEEQIEAAITVQKKLNEVVRQDIIQNKKLLKTY